MVQVFLLLIYVGGVGMRSRVGKTNRKEFHELLEASRLHELDSHHMTAREMEIDQRLINTLKAKGVIRGYGKVSNFHRQYILWGPGEKYRHYMKKWGWA